MSSSIFNLLPISSALASGDVLPIVDVSDSTQSPQGSTVKITQATYFSAIPVAVGISSTLTITSASASALAVGLAGATNPAFAVDASTASQAAGLKVTGAATGGTVAIAAIDSGSNTNLTLNAKGTGTIQLGSVSTGAITLARATGITGALTVTSNASAAVAAGPNGATNPVWQIDGSTASQAAGLKLTGAATGGSVALAVIDSGAAANLTINAKGTGTIGIGSVSTGAVTVTPIAQFADKIKLTGSSQQIWGSGTVTNWYDNAGANISLGIYDTGILYLRGVGYTGGAVAGSLVITNNVSFYGVNAAANANIALIGTDTSNRVLLDGGGAGVRIGGNPGVISTANANGFSINSSGGTMQFQIYDSGILIARGAGTTTGAAAGDFVFANNVGVRGCNSLNTTTYSIMKFNASALVQLGADAGSGGAGHVQIPYVTAANLPAAAASLNGVIAIDSTNNRLIYYSGAARYYLAGTSF